MKLSQRADRVFLFAIKSQAFPIKGRNTFVNERFVASEAGLANAE